MCFIKTTRPAATINSNMSKPLPNHSQNLYRGISEHAYICICLNRYVYAHADIKHHSSRWVTTKGTSNQSTPTASSQHQLKPLARAAFSKVPALYGSLMPTPSNRYSIRKCLRSGMRPAFAIKFVY